MTKRYVVYVTHRVVVETDDDEQDASDVENSLWFGDAYIIDEQIDDVQDVIEIDPDEW